MLDLSYHEAIDQVTEGSKSSDPLSRYYQIPHHFEFTSGFYVDPFCITSPNSYLSFTTPAAPRLRRHISSFSQYRSKPLIFVRTTTIKRHNLRPRNLQGQVSTGIIYITIHLRQFPPEIREMVFFASLSNCKGNTHTPTIAFNSRQTIEKTTPALLIALRADEQLYQEAISVYYRMNEFELGNVEDLGWLGELKDEIHKAVSNVCVTIP